MSRIGLKCVIMVFPDHNHLLFKNIKSKKWQYDILMLIKRRPPQLYVFVENNYEHEHVMITRLYIVVHILYDRNLYESIL